jgi:KilA-N domain
MLSCLAYEQINGNYWYAAYDEFNIIMMKDNSFVNATKLCSSRGRDYRNWLRQDQTKELIKYLPTINEVPDICIKSEFQDILNGSYINPLLLPSLCNWLSSNFALNARKL